jgi:seryl-tRNA(Sec) selenium transferase
MKMNKSDEKIIKDIVKREMKDFLESTQAHNIVMKMIQKELGTKTIDDKIVDLSTKVVVELFKTLWQRKSFWETSLKSVK